MSITLREALDETTRGWRQALPEPWRPVFKNVTLNSAGVPTKWKHDPWVPIFPVFKDYRTRKVFQAKGIRSSDKLNLIGTPSYAHTFRALLVPPDKVRVVILGQDPYPDITDATGQSFEQGNLKGWVQDAHNVAGSLKPILKLAAAAHTGDKRYAMPMADFKDPGWDRLVKSFASGTLKLAAPDKLFSAYQRQGVLWLNTTLTISLFRVPPDKRTGYQTAHSEYWRPFVTRLLGHLIAREAMPIVLGLWGRWAKGFKKQIRAEAKELGTNSQIRFVEAGHPVTRPFMERSKNVFTDINEQLIDLGGRSIEWFPS